MKKNIYNVFVIYLKVKEKKSRRKKLMNTRWGSIKEKFNDSSLSGASLVEEKTFISRAQKAKHGNERAFRVQYRAIFFE